MFERLTEQSKQVIRTAQDVAISMRHNHVGPEHILLGLAATSSSAGDSLRRNGLDLVRARDHVVRLSLDSGIAAVGHQSARRPLSAIGIGVSEIQRRADIVFGPGAFHFPRPQLSFHAKRLLEHGLKETIKLGTDGIDTSHMLIALLDTSIDDVAAQTLAALRVDVDAVRSEILTQLLRRAS